MDLVENITNFFKKPEEETKNKAPEGVCALCWGRQQYDGKIRTLYKDKQIDINNHKDSYMLVQDFVKTHLDGIRLKKGSVASCPQCNPDTL